MKRFRYLMPANLLAALLTVGSLTTAAPQEYVRYSAPQSFTYDELVALAQDDLPPQLEEKLQRLTTTPFVSNEAFLGEALPHRPEVEGLGSVLRVALWNIEQGIELDAIKLLLTDKDAFLSRYLQDRTGMHSQQEGGGKDQLPSINRERLLEDIDVLQTADILVLNEVDWGTKRSGYRAVVRELGQALHMNWAYGVEFLEIDPAQTGTETFDNVQDEAERKRLRQETAVDKDRLLNMHGTAILSRYPIREAVLKPFELQGYDWFKEEKNLAGLEKKKRQMAKKAGLESVLRQMRRGGRTTLSVTLDVPGIPEGRLTVVSPHLENRTAPKNRRKQMLEVLEAVRDIDHPVIIAGDLNTTMSSSEVTTVNKLLFKKYGTTEFWVNQGVKYASGLGLAYDALKFGFRTARFQSDPTAKGVKWVASNQERGLFEKVEQFRFADGKAFDFRGDPRRTINGLEGSLANSNQRAAKGFAHTFALGMTVGAKGKYKLDWFFVKAYSRDPRDRSQSYRLAPHLARTMNDVQNALARPLSDHAPLSIDLPFQEPGQLPPPRWPEKPPGADEPESWDYRGYPCRGFVQAEEDPTHRERLVWLYGYYSALRGDKFNRRVNSGRALEFRDLLQLRCTSEPDRNLIGTVAILANASPADTPAQPSGVEKQWDLRSYSAGQLVEGLQQEEENLDA
ncbi:MAG: endonuclease/exonuclease/phosphatase family protein, partial [Acidobacteriota bacterium]